MENDLFLFCKNGKTKLLHLLSVFLFTNFLLGHGKGAVMFNAEKVKIKMCSIIQQ